MCVCVCVSVYTVPAYAFCMRKSCLNECMNKYHTTTPVQSALFLICFWTVIFGICRMSCLLVCLVIFSFMLHTTNVWFWKVIQRLKDFQICAVADIFKTNFSVVFFLLKTILYEPTFIFNTFLLGSICTGVNRNFVVWRTVCLDSGFIQVMDWRQIGNNSLWLPTPSRYKKKTWGVSVGVSDFSNNPQGTDSDILVGSYKFPFFL